MNFIIFFIYVPFVCSELHTLNTTYTEKKGQTIAGIPDISAVTTLDGQQIDYYDSEIKKLIPKQDWMKEFASEDRFKEYTEFRERVKQTNKINITNTGVHVYQRMYGCKWDETGESRGFDQYSYDGQRFISLDLKELRYTASVPEAIPTVQKWNNDREQLDFLKQYYKFECVYWLKELLHFSKATFKKPGIVPKLAGQNLTEPTQKTENDTKSDGSASYTSYITYAVCIITILVSLILFLLCKLLYVLWNNWNQLKPDYSKVKYYKVHDNSTPQCTSPPKDCNQSEQSHIESSEPLASSPVEGCSQRYPRNETF